MDESFVRKNEGGEGWLVRTFYGRGSETKGGQLTVLRYSTFSIRRNSGHERRYVVRDESGKEVAAGTSLEAAEAACRLLDGSLE